MRRLTEIDRGYNYYRLLGVDPEAPDAIIRNAYRVMMRELGGHPDTGGSHDRAVLLNRAKEILLDPDLRDEYDRYWAAVEIERSSSASDARASAGWERSEETHEPTPEDRARLFQIAWEIELRSGFVSATILQRRLGIGIELAHELVARLDAYREAQVTAEARARNAAAEAANAQPATPPPPEWPLVAARRSIVGPILWLSLPALLVLAGLATNGDSQLRTLRERMGEAASAALASVAPSRPRAAATQGVKTNGAPRSGKSREAGAAPRDGRRVVGNLAPGPANDAGGATASGTYPVPAIYRVTLEALLRAEPDESTEVIARLRIGTRVKVVADAGRFLRVESMTGKSPGYVLKGAVAAAAEEATDADRSRQ